MFARERLGEREQRTAKALPLPGFIDGYATQVGDIIRQIDSHDAHVVRVANQKLRKIPRLVIVRPIRIVDPDQPAPLEQDRSTNAVIGGPLLVIRWRISASSPTYSSQRASTGKVFRKTTI